MTYSFTLNNITTTFSDLSNGELDLFREIIPMDSIYFQVQNFPSLNNGNQGGLTLSSNNQLFTDYSDTNSILSSATTDLINSNGSFGSANPTNGYNYIVFFDVTAASIDNPTSPNGGLSTVPEPSSLILLGAGLFSLLLMERVRGTRLQT